MYKPSHNIQSVAASAFHLKVDRQHSYNYSTMSAPNVGPLPAAIPLPVPKHYDGSYSKDNSGKYNYTGGKSTSKLPNYNYYRCEEGFSTYYLKNNNNASQPPLQKQQAQQHYSKPLIPPTPLSQQQAATKRRHHLSFPMSSVTNFINSALSPLTQPKFQLQTQSKAQPQPKMTKYDYGNPGSTPYPYYNNDSPPPDYMNNGNTHYPTSRPKQYAAQTKPQSQSTQPSNQRSSNQYQYQGQQQQQQGQESSIHQNYDNYQTVLHKQNPSQGHLQSTGHNRHHSLSPSTAVVSKVYTLLSVPVAGALASTIAKSTKKPGKRVTFADPITEYQNMPAPNSTSAPVKTYIPGTSILKKSSLSQGASAAEYGDTSGKRNSDGLLAYEKDKLSGGLCNDETCYSCYEAQKYNHNKQSSGRKRNVSESHYVPDGSMCGDGCDCQWEDLRRNSSYEQNMYSSGNLYRYDKLFSLSMEHMPLNEQHPYC
ncbi:hypothetical protein LPJ66_006377 [Kickxella alabastrina]|uniref:Uncharacterized protein n=1 Tax=Kickxella alabastrina TaxID=61397 RepID=A0ACC1IFR5_9FUNG|nr:hypothetical protein LPJ66_006377 [Kickxella alabastrina]